MKQLKKLVKNNESVWIYCKNRDLQEQFLSHAEKEGFLALNGQKPTELFRHYLYGINNDMTMGYLAVMIWCMSFQNVQGDYLRVDYEKYISGAEDYICHSPHFINIELND